MKKFVKGMSKDAGRVDQPNLTYRDALNAVLNSVKGAVVSEEGMSNTSFQTTEVYGSVVLENNDVIVLCRVVDRDATGASVNFHAIASLDTSTGERQLLYGTNVTNDGLNFDTEHPIEVEYKINSRGDTIIYFTDSYVLCLWGYIEFGYSVLRVTIQHFVVPTTINPSLLPANIECSWRIIISHLPL